MAENICYNCFHEKPQDGACPVCGYSPEQDRDKYPLALPHGTILNGKYILGRVLGQGGFGITYVAQDWKAKKRVAVKEYLPDTMATRIEGHTVSAYSGQREESFNYGKECFLSEAKTLAEFIGNENIVRIHSYFEENGTAYFVMEYVDGVSFQTYIRDQGGKIDWQDAGRIMFPIMDALGAVHAKGIIHRDVTPDNIFITEDGTVKLLDFGAARYSLGDRSRSLDVVLKHGYAPKEQYTRRGRQGPYTDVYSVAACFYFAVTGHKPPDSIERLDEDDLIPPSSLGVKVSETQEDALLKGLSVQAADRYQNMADFKAAMAAREETAPAAASQEPVRNETEPVRDKIGSASDVVVTGNNETQKESQISGTPKTVAKLPEIVTKLRGNRLMIPVTIAVAALVVVVAAVAIGVQDAHKKPVGNTDSVLTGADPGALKTNGEVRTPEAEASDAAQEPEEEVVYLVAKRTKREGDSINVEEYTYDKDGNELTQRWFRDGESSSLFESAYDADGNLLTRTCYREDGTVFWQEEYTYNTVGNVLSETRENYEYNTKTQYRNDCNTDGSLLSGQFYDSDGKMTSEVMYDAAGNILTKISYDADNGAIRTQNRYLYDESGNKLSCTQYDSGENVLNRWEYSYDESGKLLVEKFYSRGYTGERELRLSIQEEYFYDEAGNVLTCQTTHYYDDGHTKSEKTEYIYEYDEYDNIVKKTTNEDNSSSIIEEFEYISITRPVIAPENQRKLWSAW